MIQLKSDYNEKTGKIDCKVNYVNYSLAEIYGAISILIDELKSRGEKMSEIVKTIKETCENNEIRGD